MKGIASGFEPAPPRTPEELRAKFATDYAEFERVVKTVDPRLN